MSASVLECHIMERILSGLTDDLVVLLEAQSNHSAAVGVEYRRAG